MSLASLKPKFSMKLAFILLERKIRVGFSEKSDLSSLERKTKRNGIPNPWSLHYSEIIRHIKKKPGERDM